MVEVDDERRIDSGEIHRFELGTIREQIAQVDRGRRIEKRKVNPLKTRAAREHPIECLHLCRRRPRQVELGQRLAPIERLREIGGGGGVEHRHIESGKRGAVVEHRREGGRASRVKVRQIEGPKRAATVEHLLERGRSRRLERRDINLFEGSTAIEHLPEVIPARCVPTCEVYAPKRRAILEHVGKRPDRARVEGGKVDLGERFTP